MRFLTPRNLLIAAVVILGIYLCRRAMSTRNESPAAYADKQESSIQAQAARLAGQAAAAASAATSKQAANVRAGLLNATSTWI